MNMSVAERNDSMRIHDISVPIHPGLPVWPGDPPIELERIAKISEGKNANVSRLACSVHIGTHVDAPVHFLDGEAPVERLPLEALIGRAFVADLRSAEVVDAGALEATKIPAEAERLLLRTRNSEYWAQGVGSFQEDFVGVDESGARWIAERGIKLVGADYLSVAPYGQSRPTHKVLLQDGIVIVEGLNLSGVEAGWYTLSCLPLLLQGSDGAPARAVLIEE